MGFFFIRSTAVCHIFCLTANPFWSSYSPPYFFKRVTSILHLRYGAFHIKVPIVKKINKANTKPLISFLFTYAKYKVEVIVNIIERKRSILDDNNTKNEIKKKYKKIATSLVINLNGSGFIK